MSRYVPETFPHQWLPEKLELKTWEQIEPWYQKLMDQPIATRRRARAVGGRGRRVERGRRRGRGQALRRDDLSDRRPRARGGLSGVRSRHRAQAQADPERDPEPLPRFAVSDRSCRATAISCSTARWRIAAACFARRTSPARPSWPSWSSSTRRSIGAMTVTFRGEERTLAQMAPFLEETDRSVRQEAWELAANRRLEDRETLDDLFDQMKQLRIEIAREAGFANFVEYAFRNRERFDYGIADTVRFQEAVEHVVVPLDAQIQEKHRAALGVETLRPWDLAVDPLGRPPLAAFQGRRTARRRHRDHLSRRRPRAGRTVCLSPVTAVARPGQPQGKGPRRLPDDLRGRTAAVHLHERGRARLRRADLASRRGARLPHAGLPRRAAGGLPRKPARVLRGRLDDHGAPGRAAARPVLQPRRRRPVQPQAARGNRA